jgi:hypothetical protein
MDAASSLSPGVFIAVTLIVMGFAAYMTGQACANTWRPAWQVVVYVLMLGCVDRFLVYALFDGELLSSRGYLVDTAVLLAIGMLSFRFNRATRMVTQYPWLYERSGIIGYRERR